MGKNVVIVGGLGSGVIAYETFRSIQDSTGEWNVLGMLTDVDPEEIPHVNVIGSSDQVADYIRDEVSIHYTLHFNAKAKEQRMGWLDKLSIPDELNATAIHPDSKLDRNTVVKPGCLINRGVMSSPGAVIGRNSHVYAGAFIGHDSGIGRGCTIAAHAVIGGRVSIHKGAHIGLNSTIREDITISDYAILGAASMLTKDIPSRQIWAGNPARFLKEVGE